MVKDEKRLIVIDSNSVIHRAFHALPPLTTKKGELVNAVYGFLLVFLKAINEFQPDFVAACFDFPAPTFRHKKFKGYKAKRPPAAKELYDQIPKVKEILKVFKVPIFEKEGFEADDIIGTISKKFPKKQVLPKTKTIIISGDLDILSLVNDNTEVYLLKTGVKNTVLYDEDSVKERYSGLVPDQLVDFRALKGDPSDNIPGVTGIGEKTAIDLLKKFGTLDNLYKKLEGNQELDIKPKVKELLTEQKEQAYLSRELAEIEKNVLINISLKEFKWGKYDKEEIIKKFQDLEFNTLIKRVPGLEQKEVRTDNNLRLW
ncbi:MAG: hypothetical protein KJI71_03555 [Patescibacteria group bacterium]|nr:hypothetical protein [Patescibacteria group bacterium]